ncbi:UDP-2,3-diacylglucosamine diphosphatase [Thalassolituus sp. LLYu03]|uniref:UDP-2,3-diacylglucosamine diphosphatase n=1 Tax=Thalassolituus sp. LLYu03 TaxID=3421656 RepID=UPI003D2E307F
MSICFISDLHLEPGRPAMAQGFLQFLQNLQDTDELYILGDFFEVWMGDDFEHPFVDAIRSALKALSERGTQLFIMHGNRDFLLGQRFCEQTGATLLEDPTVVTLGEEPVLLMHGDSLCTQDVEYMKIRGMFRSVQWQEGFLAKSLEERIAFARQVRSESQSGQQMKSAEIMDVTAAEVVRVMDEAGVSTLIHGHTHRPADHQWSEHGKDYRRLVLGDWSDSSGWMIRYSDENGLELSEFPLGA